MKRHPRRGLVRILSILLLGALALGGCTSSSEQGDTDSLTIATSFVIDDLDPLDNSFWGPEFGYVELLMRPQADGRPTPWVLESLENVDETTWTLHLRDNVKFVNGRLLDADALVELIEYLNESNDGFAAAVNLGGVEAKDPTTVTLTTTVPVPGLANIFADESKVPVFDVAAYTEHVESGGEPADLIDAGLYTGPYRIVSLDAQTAEMVAVDDYWEEGGPALSKVTIKFVPEATSRVQAVQAGEADIALYMPIEVARTLEGRKDAHYVEGEPGDTTFSVQLRDNGPYADTAVRRALFAAIDYRALAEDVLDGRAGVATSVFGPSLPFAVDTQKTDLAAAADLLDEAGWTIDEASGVRTKDGDKLTLRLLSYPQQPDSNTIAIALQSQLKAVGINVTVSNVPDLTAAREGTDWDAAIVGDSLLSFSMSPEDGLRSDLVTGGSQNYMKISNAELDDLVETLSRTFDESTRIDLLQQIQQVIHEDGLWAATVRRVPAWVTSEAWKGVKPPSVANLWIDSTTAPTS